ncbi:MAG TPA: 4'-phosphopantetheinyl transferase superfamily protein [Acidothermaceae bacterium]
MPVAVDIAYVETPDAEPLGVRRQFGRSLMRRLVDARLGAGVARVETAESGQPVVLGAARPAFVSLTHTDRLVAAAFATTRVGIDAEPLDRAPSRPSLRARVCSPAELRWLDELPESQQSQGFLRLWTRKEAYGKAIGVGIGFGLRSTDFVPDDAPHRGVPGGWHAREVALSPDVVAAVVVEGSIGRIELTKVDPRELADLG